MNRFRRVALLLFVLLLAACNGNGDDPSPTASPSESAPAESPTPAETEIPSPSPGTGEPPTTAPSPTTSGPCPTVGGGAEGTDVNLVAVRVGSHTGFDRITFEFADPQPPSPANMLPRFTIEKVDQVIQDGSGEPVQVNGAALYAVVMHGASGVELSGDQVVETYKGSKEFKPNFPTLLELQHAGDFENVLTWGIGLKEPRCINARQFNSPLRLVLDIPR